jgi:prepilin-type processing-associated H-X9-DG protein
MSLRSMKSAHLAFALGLAGSLSSAAAAAELVTNGNFSSGLTGFGTTYDQTDANGYLFITTDPHLLCSSCFPSIGDHTTGTGNMLFVDGAAVGDGATPASHPYYSVTLGVVPNSSYTFSYWTANLGNAGPNPLLATYINGLLVGSTFTPAYAQWTLFTYTFNSGPSTSLAFALSDLTQTHSFNDFALDDVSLQGPVPGAVTFLPEPSTWAMMLLGFGALGAALRYSRRKQRVPALLQ